jgi:cytochrome c553
VLDHLFGTPAEPKVAVGDPATLAALAVDADTLKANSGGYKMRCGTCHGMTGDGRGTVGLYLTPQAPRDFRTGKFKRVSGAGVASGRPRLDDLVRVLKEGVPGTSMTSFGVLPDDTLRGLTGAVIHLSIRGEVELELLKLASESAEPVTDWTAEAERLTLEVLGKWSAAQADGPMPVVVPERPEATTPEYHQSIRRGQKLFVATGCVSCHEGYGRMTVYRSDAWGLPNAVRNLGQPERRWSATDTDTARQIRHGIAAAHMPGSPSLTDADVIDLVHFVRELPYPKRLPDYVRSEVEK